MSTPTTQDDIHDNEHVFEEEKFPVLERIRSSRGKMFVTAGFIAIFILASVLGVVLTHGKDENTTALDSSLVQQEIISMKTEMKIIPSPASSSSQRALHTRRLKTPRPVARRPSKAPKTNSPSMAPTKDNFKCENAKPIFANGSVVNDTMEDSPDEDNLDSYGYYESCGFGLNNMAYYGSPLRWYRLIGNGMMVTATICNSGISSATADPYLNAAYGSFILVYTGDCTYTCLALIRHPAVGNCVRYSWYAEENTPYNILVRNNGEEGMGFSGPFSLSLNANDHCEYATEIRPNLFQLGSTRAANQSLAAPVCNEMSDVTPGVWFWTKGTGQTFSFDTCRFTTANTKIAVFTGTCNTNQLQCVTVVDNSYRCKVQSSVSWKTIANKIYFVYVYGQPGSFALTGTSSPQNDICEGASAIALSAANNSSAPLPSHRQISGTTVGATVRSDAVYFYDRDFTFSTCGFFVDESPGVWYRLRGNQDVRVMVDVCNSPRAGGFQPQVLLFEGTCKDLTCEVPTVEYSSCSGGTDYSSPKDRVTWTAKANTTYFLFVQGTTPVTGRFTLSVNTSATN